MERFAAAQEKNIKNWFDKYKQVLKSLGTKNRKNVINFDEARFKVGCMKSHKILLPKNVSKVSTN